MPSSRLAAPWWALVACLPLLVGSACAPAAPSNPAASSPSAADRATPSAARPEAAPRAEAAAPPAASAPPRTIRLGIPSLSMNFMHAGLAEQSGLAREHGLIFELQQSSRGASLTVATLVADQLDYAYAFESVVNAALQGAALRGIMIVQQAAPYVLVATPDVPSIADLRGKVVGQGGPASALGSVLRQMLTRSGVPPDGFTAVSLGEDPERLAALQTGAIQATVFSPPFHRKATQAGMVVLGRASDYDVVSPNGLGTSQAVLDNRRDEARAVIQTLFQTTAWMRSHRDEVLAYLVQRYDIDRETADESYDLLMASWSTTGLLTPDQIESTASRWREMSNLPADADITSAVDFSLVQEVRRALGN